MEDNELQLDTMCEARSTINRGLDLKSLNPLRSRNALQFWPLTFVITVNGMK